MTHLTYLGLLAICLLATAPLELWLRCGVYVRWHRLAIAVVPVVLIFGGWDVAAIATHQWSYSQRYLVGVTLPGHLPLEELLFFLVIPTCSILTLEAVQRVRPQWRLDEVRLGEPS